MNLNHIQTVAKYESKIFAKLALLDYGRFVACRDIGRFTDLFFHLWIFGTDGIGPFIAIFLFTGLLYAVLRRLSTDFSV